MSLEKGSFVIAWRDHDIQSRCAVGIGMSLHAVALVVAYVKTVKEYATVFHDFLSSLTSAVTMHFRCYAIMLLESIRANTETKNGK